VAVLDTYGLSPVEEPVGYETSHPDMRNSECGSGSQVMHFLNVAPPDLRPPAHSDSDLLRSSAVYEVTRTSNPCHARLSRDRRSTD
jgi:hypothetical protein